MDQYLDTLQDNKSLVLQQYDALRAIWGDILQGFSYSESKKLYVRHLGDIEHGEIAQIQTNLTMKFLKMGVPTRQERLDFIMKESEEWTQDDEDEITSCEYFISDNEETWKGLTMADQKKHLGKLLEENREKLWRKRQEKENLIGAVAETKAEKLANAYYIYFAFKKNEELTEPLWQSKEEFDEVEDSELGSYIYAYNESLQPFTTLNFQKLAAMPFTLNLASYCKDQGMFFLGKPITQFSNYQLGVFTKVMRNSFVLRETKTVGAPEINNELTMKKLLDWYDHEYQVIMAENNSSQVTTKRM